MVNLAAAGDMPTFAASNYAANTYVGDNFFTPSTKPLVGMKASSSLSNQLDGVFMQALKAKQAEQQETQMASRRMVQVLIVDPNDNIPLDKCLLYEGKPKLTDATDQELFFELDIKNLLAAHNQERVKFIDKKVKDRTEYLEAAKVRDLKMVVVKIAEF